jgi:hypothetical protein
MSLSKKRSAISLIVFILSLLVLPVSSFADLPDDQRSFFVDPQYNIQRMGEVSATQRQISEKAYFYVSDQWWSELTEEDQRKADHYLDSLAREFDDNIYPVLTTNYGEEWNPGIDKDDRITILLYPMKEGVGGYFRFVDEYPRLYNPRSNVREMIYVNVDFLMGHYIKSLVAHEFTHLITFNQKEKLRGISEETWLNEARAEYASTLTGYDKIYEGSNLQKRTKIFLHNSSDSIVGWTDKVEDYGGLNLFTQYLTEHYGKEILIDSLQSGASGIASINQALIKNGFKEDFAQIFTDWGIAVYINDCSLDTKYCYLNQALKDLHVIPETNFLPLRKKSQLSADGEIGNWSLKWIRFIGGEGDLRIEFIGSSENLFNIPYVIKDREGEWEIKFLSLDEYQKGELLIPGFGSEKYSVTILPSIQSKVSGFNGQENKYPFSWEATADPRLEQMRMIEELRKRIRLLEEEIVILKGKIITVLIEQEGIEIESFGENLYLGIKDSDQVRALQIFLKVEGGDIFPNGLITGNFSDLTQQAVSRFQEKYAKEILEPLNLSKGTGYFGPQTRKEVNRLLFSSEEIIESSNS